jgi:hypothetical protein
MPSMTTVAPPVVTDLTEVDPGLAELRDRASGGDLAGALAELTSLRNTGPDEHATACDVLARAEGLDPMLLEVLADTPFDREARCLWAQRAVLDAETNGVTDRLLEVEPWLTRLCATDDADPHPWYLRLMTARLLRLGTPEARRRYRHLAAIEPHHGAAQRELLRSLSPASGGTWDDALAFARSVAAGAPAGSPLGTVVAGAHLERWFEDSHGDNPYYLARPEVIGEVESAADRWMSAAPGLSAATVLPHTELAVVFALTGNTRRAKTHFRALGTAVAPMPWDLAVRHRDRLEQLRATALTEEVEA